MSQKPISRKSNVVESEVEKELLIYDLTNNKAFCLNETSALVYQLADGRKTVAEISDVMSIKLQTKVSEDLVWLALDGLKKDNLLENVGELPDYLTGLTRREAVRKVGLASMVMLPVITAIIAPQAAMAQSCAPNGSSCTFAANTQSNCCNSDQRCWSPAGPASSTCRPCFTGGTPVGSCQGGDGCCAARDDRNQCCSNTFNFPPPLVGPDYQCICAP